MTATDDTSEYIKNFFTMITSPGDSAAMNGTLQSPSNFHSDLFVLEGASTIITNTAASRIETVLDAEATLRNTGPKVMVYQYNTVGTLLEINEIDVLSGTSADFHSGGLIAARLDVSNASSYNEISGSMTGAVINTTPKQLHNLTQTQLKQRVRKNPDKVSVEMKDGGVSLLSVTSHLGLNDAVLSDTISPNEQVWFKKYSMDFSVQDTGSSTGFINTGTLMFASTTGNVGTDITPATALARTTDDVFIWDSNRLPLSDRPFTQATFGIQVDTSFEVDFTTTGRVRTDFTCIILDQEGKVLDSQKINIVESTTFGATAPAEAVRVNLKYEFRKLSRPVARVCIYLSETSEGGISTPGLQPTGTSDMAVFHLRGIENTSDVPDRDTHIIVAEGVNGGAALSVRCGLVISGIPSPDRTFISGSSLESNINDQLMLSYLHSILKTVPRANLISEIGDLRNVMIHLMETPEHKAALHAWSFGEIATAFNTVTGLIRKGARGVDKVLVKALPILKNVATVARGYEQDPKMRKFMRPIGDFASGAHRVGSMVHNVTQYADDGTVIELDPRKQAIAEHMYALHGY